MRISDIQRGMVPEFVTFGNEPYCSDFRIDFMGEHNLHNGVQVKGSTKTMHLWNGDEGETELAAAVLPPHTLQWYAGVEKTIRRTLGGVNWHRDIGVVRAIQNSFDQNTPPE